MRPSDGRCFPRFRCLRCGRSFSSRTFAADYWLRRRDLFPQITAHAVAGSGLRQTARLFAVSHATVLRHLSRAGRLCLLFHQELTQRRPIREPLVIDGFETFEYAQYFPFHLNLAAGAHSWFLYHFTDSPLRRKGAMAAAQKRRRAELEAALGRPDPKAVEVGIRELLRPLLPRWQTGPLGETAFFAPEASGVGEPCRAENPPGVEPNAPQLHSDDHPAYPRGLRRLCAEYPDLRIRHLITPSTARRTLSNPLFPVNLAELLLRHTQANHRRETIAFSKRRQGALERAAIFTVWRNVIKRRRENGGEATAAMRIGLLGRPLDWTEILASRRFPHRRWLPGPWWSYYWRKVKTPALGARQTEHSLRFAF